MPRSIYRLNDRSEEVAELISRIPGWMVRWGTITISLLLAGLLIAAWEIRYPDIVSGTFRLSSDNMPRAIYTRMDGKLVRLFVHNGSRVKEGQVLAYMESTGNHQEIARLDTVLQQMYKAVTAGDAENTAWPDPRQFNRLGEIQADFQRFGASLAEFSNYLRGGYYNRKKTILQQELADLQSLAASLEKQEKFQDRNRQLAVEEYTMHQKLAAQRVIAPNELKQAESRELSRMLPAEQAKAALIQNNNEQKEKQKELLDLDNQAAQYRSTFLQQLNTFRSTIDEWKSKYLVTAPLAGTVYFSTVIQENQYLPERQLLFSIAPPGNGYFGELALSQQNFGKIKLHQRVLVKFAGYPFEQYGYVPGEIAGISDAPVNDSIFLARVNLPQGLKTNYRQPVVYKNGLLATGEVVTADVRLLQRLFFNMRKALGSR